MKSNKNYEKRARKILRTYNSILVKCQNIPMLSDKNIILVENIEGMINAQIETRKPILYFQEEKCISFMILDGAESYIYILKANNGVVSKVEHIISNFEYARNTFVKDILSKIETVLLNGSVEGELTSNDIKYLESMKGNNLNDKIRKIQKKENRDTEINDNFSEKRQESNSDDLYLVPVKKRRRKA